MQEEEWAAFKLQRHQLQQFATGCEHKDERVDLSLLFFKRAQKCCRMACGCVGKCLVPHAGVPDIIPKNALLRLSAKC